MTRTVQRKKTSVKSMTSQKRKTPPKGTFFCDVCNVNYPPNCEENHMTGKKHQLLADIRNKQAARSSHSIYVTNLPAGAHTIELREYFNKFGPVSNVHIREDKGFCFVEFSQPVDSLEVLKVKHNLFGQELIAKPYKMNPKPKAENINNVSFDITRNPQILANIRDVLPFEQQVQMFLALVQLSETELLTRGDFVAGLSKNLEQFFPGSKLEVFGSTANGLGFTGCDIDLTLFLPSRREESQTITLEKKDIPMPYDVHFGRFPRENLSYLCREGILFFVARLLQRLPGFQFARLIPSSRCPIVKFHHKVTNICGDISFSKSLGLANTQLLRLYGQLDFNVYALLMILRFWGKRERFVGSNHLISSYAFSWLVIFYLQKKNLVPTVEILASLSDIKMEADGWDCTFCENLKIIPVKSKEKTLSELIIGFFEFYANFDFTVNIICPRDGSSAVKSELLAEAGEQLDFKITSMSVQDVFDLTHNITGSVNDNTLLIFLSKCNDQHSFWKTVKTPTNMNLMQLFDPASVSIPDLQAPLSVSPTTASKPPTPDPKPMEFTSGGTKYLWKAPASATGNIGNRPSRVYGKDAIHLFLMSKHPGDIAKACSLVLDIFKRAFYIEYKSIEISPEYSIHSSSPLVRVVEERPAKKKKVSEGEEAFILSVACNASYRTWVGRKKVKGNISRNSLVTQLAIEENIAKQIMRDLPNITIKPGFKFEVKFFFIPQKLSLKITFTPVTIKNEVVYTVLPYIKKFIVNFEPDRKNL